jgi:hypothetical protein
MRLDGADIRTLETGDVANLVLLRGDRPGTGRRGRRQWIADLTGIDLDVDRPALARPLRRVEQDRGADAGPLANVGESGKQPDVDGAVALFLTGGRELLAHRAHLRAGHLSIAETALLEQELLEQEHALPRDLLVVLVGARGARGSLEHRVVLRLPDERRELGSQPPLVLLLGEIAVDVVVVERDVDARPRPMLELQVRLDGHEARPGRTTLLAEDVLGEVRHRTLVGYIVVPAETPRSKKVGRSRTFTRRRSRCDATRKAALDAARLAPTFALYEDAQTRQ